MSGINVIEKTIQKNGRIQETENRGEIAEMEIVSVLIVLLKMTLVYSSHLRTIFKCSVYGML